MKRSILFATQNPNKVLEVNQLLSGSLEVIPLQKAGVTEELPETQDTLEGNALQKARYVKTRWDGPVFAEDTGLEVDALNGEPGVRSARYCGLGETRSQRDKANNLRLLNALVGVPDERRSARFVCAMCVATPEGEVIATARGAFEGRIAHSPRGSQGFGYDPLLVVMGDDPLAGRHAAELQPGEKHARSHRGRAARAIAERLQHSPIFR